MQVWARFHDAIISSGELTVLQLLHGHALIIAVGHFFSHSLKCFDGRNLSRTMALFYAA